MRKIIYKHLFLNHKSHIARFFAAYGWGFIITTIAMLFSGNYDSALSSLLATPFVFLTSYIVEFILNKTRMLNNKFIKKYIFLNNKNTNAQIYALFGWVFTVAGVCVLFTGELEAGLAIMGFSVFTFIYSSVSENMRR